MHDLREAVRTLRSTPVVSAIAVALGITCGLAGWLPARRAARTEPALVLRDP